MRIVLGLHEFSAFAGTETYTLTLAEELARLGHDVVVATPSAGPIADVARGRGVEVASGPDRWPQARDVAIAQDACSAYLLAQRYPEARRVFIAHSDYFALQSPPQLPGVCHAVVVLNDRVRRQVEQLAVPPRLIRLRQPVDLRRFGTRGGLPQQARRVLVLGNYLRHQAAQAVTEACHRAGLEPVLSGIHTAPTASPERSIADVEIVIGLGRCVVEAMAGRRAAYVYGIAGGDGWVTPQRYDALEADGFGGTASELVVDPTRLAADLAQWDPEMGPRNRQLAAAHHDATAHAVELVAAVRALEPDPGPTLQHADELARLVRLEWQTWSRYVEALEENRALRAELEHQRSESGRAHEAAAAAAAAAHELAEAAARRESAGIAAAEARVAAVLATRRYRAASLLAAPVDRLRRAHRHRG